MTAEQVDALSSIKGIIARPTKETVKAVRIARPAPQFVVAVLPVERVATFAAGEPVVACICSSNATTINDVITITTNDVVASYSRLVIVIHVWIIIICTIVGAPTDGIVTILAFNFIVGLQTDNDIVIRGSENLVGVSGTDTWLIRNAIHRATVCWVQSFTSGLRLRCASENPN
jgi:hypothetical protein